MSSDELDRQIPVSPPIVNRKMNPSAHRVVVVYLIFVP